MDNAELLRKRFTELANRAYNSGIYTFTNFLGLSDFSVFESAKQSFRHVPYTVFGGAEGTERIMVRFGDENEIGYEAPFPIVCIKAEPVSQKFADKLTHRDFLGAILNLGIERSSIGDIPIINNTAYIFAKEDIADFIISSLFRVKHTEISLSVVSEIPKGELFKTERRTVQLQSERIDALIAKLFSLSREAAQNLIKRELVFVSGKLCTSTSYAPKAEDIISVRGYGRLIYRSYSSTTRKGKFNVEVDVYV